VLIRVCIYGRRPTGVLYARQFDNNAHNRWGRAYEYAWLVYTYAEKIISRRAV